MSTKENDFLKINVRDVDFKWPRLDQPYRFNSQTQQTEACAPTVQGAGYSITWEVDKTEGRRLFEALRDHYNNTRARNPKLPEFTGVFGMKRDDTAGTVRFTAKRTCVSNDGKIKPPPQVVDWNREDLKDKAIWSGSKGDVRCYAFAVTDPQGKGGISLTFDAVQIKVPVYGGSLEDDFGVAPPPAKSLDDAPPPPAAAASAPPPSARASIPDDSAWA